MCTKDGRSCASEADQCEAPSGGARDATRILPCTGMTKDLHDDITSSAATYGVPVPDCLMLRKDTEWPNELPLKRDLTKAEFPRLVMYYYNHPKGGQYVANMLREVARKRTFYTSHGDGENEVDRKRANKVCSTCRLDQAPL